MRRYLMPSTLLILTIAVLVWAAPDPPSNLTTGGTNTPDFPGAPSNISIDFSTPVVNNFALTDQVGSDPYYVPGNVAWTVDCTDDIACTSCQLRQGGTPVGTADTTPTGNQFGGTWATGLTSGNDTQYTLDVTCTDGTTAVDSSDIVATADVTGPVASVDDFLDTSLCCNIDILATVTDASSGVSSVQFTLNDGGGASNIGTADVSGPPWSLESYDSTQEADDVYDVGCVATDSIGNTSNCTTKSIAIDNTDPSAVANLACTASSSTEIDCTWDASTDTGGTGIQHYRVGFCDATAIPGCTPTLTDTSFANAYIIGGLTSETTYNFAVTSVDNADNENTTAATDTETTPTSGEEIPPNLVGYWPLDEGTGTTTEDEGITPDSDGTLTGSPLPVWSTTCQDINGSTNCIAFAQAGEHLAFANNAELQFSGRPNLTLAAWINQDIAGATGTFHGLMTCSQHGNATGTRIGMMVHDGSRLRLDVGDGAAMSSWETSTGVIPTGSWVHVGVTIASNNEIKFYINGTQSGSTVTLDRDIAVNTFAWELGRVGFSSGTSGQFDGRMDDVRIYARTLPAAEMAELANMPGGGAPPSADRSVAPTGSNTGDCSNPGSPCQTITYAYAQAVPGDVISLADGVYTDYTSGVGLLLNKNGTASNPITIRAANKWQAHIDGQDLQARKLGVKIDGNYNILDGVVVRDAWHEGVYITGDNVTVKNCLIRNNGNDAAQSNEPGAGTGTGLIDTQAVSGNVYVGNYIHNNGRALCCNTGVSCTPVTCNLDHGMYLNGDNTLVANNIVRDNEAFGIQLAGGTYSWSNGKVFNNTILFNDRSGMVVWNLMNNVDIFNNIFYKNGELAVSIFSAEGTDLVFHTNILYQNGTGTIVNTGSTVEYTVTNSITGDPLFVNENSDWNIQLGSAAHNAGLDTSPDVVDDFDGLARPQGGVYDIGAHEFDE